MIDTELEGAWYARGGSKAREFYTMLHLPYTSMVLSYVLIGVALSPTIYADRLILSLIAYFLGLGFSAHALNELHARHWGVALSRRELEAVFLLPLSGALAIGTYGMYELYHSPFGGFLASLNLLALIFLETFFVFAYNTEFFGGTFHSDLSFAFSWAALPFLTSYYVQSLTVTASSLLVGASLAATGAIEINLSRWCKDFRRKGQVSKLEFADGERMSTSTFQLIAMPEKSLKLIVVAVDLMALGLLLFRFIL